MLLAVRKRFRIPFDQIESQSFGDRRSNERRISHRGELDEIHPGDSVGRHHVREFERKPRLPHSARPGERHQTDDGIGEPGSQRLQVSVPAEDDRKSSFAAGRTDGPTPTAVPSRSARDSCLTLSDRRSMCGGPTAWAFDCHRAVRSTT